MSITTRPGPDGRLFSHSVIGHAASQPDERYTDAVLDLERMEQGSHGLPAVDAWEAADGTWGVEVTVWSSNPEPTPEEVAALEGTLSEVLASTKL